MLDAAGRPTAAALGAEVIRFSSQPALGGRAFIIEVLRVGDGTGRVAGWWLDGHPRIGWTRRGSAAFRIPPGELRRLEQQVDDALASYSPRRLPRRDNDDDEREGPFIMCMDGPDFLTERVRGGRLVSLRGFCPPTEHAEHPNERVAQLLLRLACRRIGNHFAGPRRSDRSCRRYG